MRTAPPGGPHPPRGRLAARWVRTGPGVVRPALGTLSRSCRRLKDADSAPLRTLGNREERLRNREAPPWGAEGRNSEEPRN